MRFPWLQLLRLTFVSSSLGFGLHLSQSGLEEAISEVGMHPTLFFNMRSMFVPFDVVSSSMFTLSSLVDFLPVFAPVIWETVFSKRCQVLVACGLLFFFFCLLLLSPLSSVVPDVLFVSSFLVCCFFFFFGSGVDSLLFKLCLFETFHNPSITLIHSHSLACCIWYWLTETPE